MLIDTHAHLTDVTFSHDLADVLARANAAGITGIICMSNSLADAHHLLQLHEQHGTIIHVALGLHPTHVTTQDEATLSAHMDGIRTLLSAHGPHIVALGEVGLDYMPHTLRDAPSAHAAKMRQRTVFTAMIHLARLHNLPLSVHSRGAGHHALDLITDIAREQGGQGPSLCMHAFDGRPIHAERALQKLPNTLYFSIPPCMARSAHFVKLVMRIPLSRLLLESDAPALAAVAGERNEPAEIAGTLALVADIKQRNLEETRSILFQNTLACFPRMRAADQVVDEKESSRLMEPVSGARSRMKGSTGIDSPSKVR